MSSTRTDSIVLQLQPAGVISLLGLDLLLLEVVE